MNYEIQFEDLSGKPEPGMERFRQFLRKKRNGRWRFFTCVRLFLNEALFPGGTKGECAEWFREMNNLVLKNIVLTDDMN